MSRVLPILFNAEMVRAILEGRKSCTRKIVKSQQLIGMLPDKCKNGAPEKFLKEKKLMFKPYCDMTDIELINTAYKAPYQPGDILYVRETWKKAPNGYYYYEDWQRNDIADVTKWKPSIHMPKEAARIWLRVTDVRVERLQEITVDGCHREGINIETSAVTDGETLNRKHDFSLEKFETLWDSTVKKSDIDRYGWDANPWVWVIEFERCEKPKGV